MRVGWFKVEVFQLNCWLIKFKIYHYAIIFAWIFDCDSKTITKRVAGEAAEGLSYDDYDFNFVHNSLLIISSAFFSLFASRREKNQFFSLIEYFIKEKREKYKKNLDEKSFSFIPPRFNRVHICTESTTKDAKRKSPKIDGEV